MNIFLDTLFQRKDELLKALLEHVQISLLSLIIAIFIAVPIGIILIHYKKTAEIVLQITGIFQTIPSLALLGLLIPIIGIGTPPALLALIIYALFPIIQNTYTGLSEIDPSLEEAAEAFGMTKLKKLTKYRIPLALPYIVSGIRTAAVLIIGTATLAALIGAGGLGTFILLGIDRNNISLILIGAISSASLAVIFNFGIHLLEKSSVKTIIITFFIIILTIGGSFIYTNRSIQAKEIVAAGKLGSEPDILINMYKKLIENKSDIKVTLKPNFGKTSFLFNALKSDEIDLYPEFSGTLLETFLTNPISSNDPREVYEFARDEILKEHGLIYLEPMKFQNTYAIAVKEDFAIENSLKTIEDLKPIQNELIGGFTLEFLDRDDGYPGIEELYNLNFKTISMEPALRYQAIDNNNVNLIDAYSTDSELEEYNLVLLEDNKNLFPPYQGAPLLKKETLKKYPELEDILNVLSGKITEEEMSEMNYKVNILDERPEKVASDYLNSKNLLD